MEISLRLDTLGIVEMHYLRGRERYRDWPGFELLAASRQARILAYLNHEVAEQLHTQILAVETSVGLSIDDDADEDEDDALNGHAVHERHITKSTDREPGTFSPVLAQALDRLNDLAHQRLGNTPNVGPPSGELVAEIPGTEREVIGEGEMDEAQALEQLQDAFVEMMEVVRELTEELSTDALKITGRFRCARTNIEFRQAEDEEDDDDDEEEDDDEVETDKEEVEVQKEEGLLEVELVLVLQLFEEGRSRVDDLPAAELQLDVDDFERLHETLDDALEQERRSRRRK